MKTRGIRLKPQHCKNLAHHAQESLKVRAAIIRTQMETLACCEADTDQAQRLEKGRCKMCWYFPDEEYGFHFGFYFCDACACEYEGGESDPEVEYARLCEDCSIALNACRGCGASLAEDPPAC